MLALGLLASSVFAAGIIAKPHTVKADSAYTTKNSIVYRNKRGTMRIYQAKGFHMIDEVGYLENQIVLYGTLKNNSNRGGLTPEDFFNEHFNAYRIRKSSWRQLHSIGSLMFAPTNYTRYLSNNATDYVKPHKTLRFAVASEDDDMARPRTGERVVVRAYNDAYLVEKAMASKNFYLPTVKTAKDHQHGSSEKITAKDKSEPERDANELLKPKKYRRKNNSDAKIEGQTYDSKFGTFTITNAQAFNYSPTYSNPRQIACICLEGHFTNKTKMVVSPISFLDDYLSTTVNMSGVNKKLNFFYCAYNPHITSITLANNSDKDLKQGKYTHFKMALNFYGKVSDGDYLTVNGFGTNKKQIIGTVKIPLEMRNDIHAVHLSSSLN